VVDRATEVILSPTLTFVIAMTTYYDERRDRTLAGGTDAAHRPPPDRPHLTGPEPAAAEGVPRARNLLTGLDEAADRIRLLIRSRDVLYHRAV
jgi:hypothetical protein